MSIGIEEKNQRRRKLSVVMPTYNRGKIIKIALDSLLWADEIIIMDNFSTDNTKEICLGYPNVNFYQRSGVISECFNEAVRLAKYDWIMRNDADEIITRPLAEEIQRKVLCGDDSFDGYFAKEVTYFYGKWVPCTTLAKGYHGGKEKIFKKGYYRYECKREHEPPIINGKWGYLDHYFLHYSIPTIGTQLRKIAYHAQKDADRINIIQNKPMSRARLAYRTLKSFVSVYFRNHLWRLGYHGIVMTMLEALYPFVFRAMVWEKYYKHQHKIDADNFPPAADELRRIIGHDL